LYGQPIARPTTLEQRQLVQSQLFNDRRTDICTDRLIDTVVNYLRYPSRADYLIRHAIQGKPIPNERIVTELLADKQKERDICAIVSNILQQRQWRAIDQVEALVTAGIPIDPVSFAVKNLKQQKWEQEIAQVLQEFYRRDNASLVGAAASASEYGNIGFQGVYGPLGATGAGYIGAGIF